MEELEERCVWIHRNHCWDSYTLIGCRCTWCISCRCVRNSIEFKTHDKNINFYILSNYYSLLIIIYFFIMLI
jgi:hypothetical protein